MSYVFTNNMAKLRALTFYNNVGATTVSNSGFVDLTGTTFTGYLVGSSSYDYANSRTRSIFGYSPTFYISEDATEIAAKDYELPEDAVAISYSTAGQAVASNDGVATTLQAYTQRTATDEIFTVRKILIVGSIGTSSTSSSSSSTALLFEELLDSPIILNPGDSLLRNYEFRLDFT